MTLNEVLDQINQELETGNGFTCKTFTGAIDEAVCEGCEHLEACKEKARIEAEALMEKVNEDLKAEAETEVEEKAEVTEMTVEDDILKELEDTAAELKAEDEGVVNHAPEAKAEADAIDKEMEEAEKEDRGVKTMVLANMLYKAKGANAAVFTNCVNEVWKKRPADYKALHKIIGPHVRATSHVAMKLTNALVKAEAITWNGDKKTAFEWQA